MLYLDYMHARLLKLRTCRIRTAGDLSTWLYTSPVNECHKSICRTWSTRLSCSSDFCSLKRSPSLGGRPMSRLISRRAPVAPSTTSIGSISARAFLSCHAAFVLYNTILARLEENLLRSIRMKTCVQLSTATSGVFKSRFLPGCQPIVLSF